MPPPPMGHFVSRYDSVLKHLIFLAVLLFFSQFQQSMEAKIELYPDKEAEPDEVTITAMIIKWIGGPRRKMLSGSNNDDSLFCTIAN